MSRRNLPAVPPGARPPATRPHGRGTVSRLQTATHVIDRLATRIIPYDPTQLSAPEQRARPTILLGLTLFFLLFGVFGLWGSLVPLASGAVAPGKLVVDSNSKQIQHLEGGIIKEILVKEGDAVTEGQPLIRLDNTSANAKNDMIQAQYFTARAAEARLIAERDNKESVTFPPELTGAESSYPQLHDIMDTQRRLFTAHHDAMTGQIGVLNQKIAQSSDEAHGYREQVAADNAQIKLLDDEITTVQGLLAQGNALRPRLLSLQRSQADLLGQRGQAEAMASRAEQSINEAKINIINQKTTYLNNAVSDLKTTQTQLSDLTEQGRAAGDVARRIEIDAPITGTVTGLAVHTVGGVVQPGQTLMNIVPSNDKLIVEAHVSPLDIESIHAGMPAQVRLMSLHQRTTRPLQGTVTTISADRFDDMQQQAPQKGEVASPAAASYYLARIEIPQSEIAMLGEVKLVPGMPAEALIITGSRTLISYLVRPIRESFGHAFHQE